jgi:ribose 5-phosphate isomerase A
MADIEAAKRAAALEAVTQHFPENPRFVGIGSGTTVKYVVEAIKGLGKDVSRIGFIPTGYQSKQLIIDAGLVPIEFDALPDDARIEIAFDGADEVDDDMNCIKGGGACLYQEKLVAMRAKAFICVAGRSGLICRMCKADERKTIVNSSHACSPNGPLSQLKWNQRLLDRSCSD